MPHFVDSVEEIRQRAIHKIDDGAVTEAYGLDQEQANEVLNEALATEIVCVLRYMHHYFMATGVHGMSVRDEFKEHADAEREHADRIAERIQQLGGKPDFDPRRLMERSASQYVEGESLADMIREDLIAERVVIEVYTKMIRFFGDKDPVTRRMLEEILKDEEEHASDLSDLLYVVDPHTGETEGEEEALEAPAKMEGRKPKSGATDILPAHEPGTTGRPTRKRSKADEIELEKEDVIRDAGRGSNRSVHITRPNRKGKRVA